MKGRAGTAMDSIMTSFSYAPVRRVTGICTDYLGGIAPGVALTFAIAALAFGLRQVPGVAAFSPMILAILIGTAFQNIVGTPAVAKAGVAFSMRRILRAAIVMLGLQLTVVQLIAVGVRGIVIIAAALAFTFAFTIWMGRVLGVDRKLAHLIAAGTSICGASAVIAANTVTQAPDEDVTYAVACVTVFGSIAMFVYPLLPALLGLDPHAYGLWSGASIHEIAQVVAAAFQQGQQAGEFGIVAKLSRVMMLAPMIVGIGLVAARVARSENLSDVPAARPPVPWFVFGFVAMVGFNSLVEIPAEARAWIVTLTAFLLSAALAAMGLETDIHKLAAKGFYPALLAAFAFVFISGFSLLLIKLFG